MSYGRRTVTVGALQDNTREKCQGASYRPRTICDCYKQLPQIRTMSPIFRNIRNPPQVWDIVRWPHPVALPNFAQEVTVKGRINHLYNTFTCRSTYIQLKDEVAVFHNIWGVFYISYSFNLWGYLKVYMKRLYCKRFNSHISDVSIIDWLLIWYWKAVEESGRRDNSHISDVSIIDWLII